MIGKTETMPTQSDATGRAALRVATFNCNSIRTRMDTVLAWLHIHQPDVLALQETKVIDALFPVGPLMEAGYHVTFRGMKGYNGVALLSRRPPDEVRFGLEDGGPADEPRLLHARFGKLHVVNTYVPQGRAIDHPMFAYKVEWFTRLRAFLDRHIGRNEPALWMGDLNVAAEPIDVYNPAQRTQHVCYHEAVRRAFAHARMDVWHDVYRRHHPEPGRYSFFDYRTDFSAEHPEGWRLDYILATAPLAELSQHAQIDLKPRRGERPSDHAPVLADFRFIA